MHHLRNTNQNSIIHFLNHQNITYLLIKKTLYIFNYLQILVVILRSNANIADCINIADQTQPSITTSRYLDTYF